MTMRRGLKTFLTLSSILLVSLTSISVGHTAAVDQKSVQFLIDTSGSMKGAKLLGVKKAFNAIIDSLPSDVQAGVITFSSKASVLVPLTSDRTILKIAVTGLQANGETAIRDAVKLGLQNTAQYSRSRIILLTDGEDTVSTTNLTQLQQWINMQMIPVDSIGLQTTVEQGKSLQELSDLSGGDFYSLDTLDNLIAVYKKSLSTIINQIEAPAPTPSSTIKSVGFSRDYLSIEPYFISISFFFTFLLLLVFIRKLFTKNKTKQVRFSILEKYELRKNRSTETLREIRNFDYESIPEPIKNWVKTRLDIIHSDISYTRTMNRLLILFIGLFIFFTVILSNFFVALVFSSLGTPFIFNSYIKNKRQKQVRLFADELPDFLNIVASALKSGLTMSQGMEAFSLENKGEVARQMRRASSEIQMGSTIEDSLMQIAERMNNEDLKWTVTALSIQRNVGGSFASILSTTYVTVKERAEIRREVRTLSAEGKLSAYILMALPIGIFFFLLLTKRDYVKIFWTTFSGILLLGIIATSLTVGWLWIKKIIEIKI